ncbi:hypothetical protein AN403_5997 [Pseudomonas fluorescens]|uniref:Uncharacterized protein n=1 Tax=Pseudomonas fluorescens TaxID=294 RepID=A0A0P8XWV7_PSEFL|nr:hypothetical protein AN403_5997 [Pseudomonas fluorescens]
MGAPSNYREKANWPWKKDEWSRGLYHERSLRRDGDWGNTGMGREDCWHYQYHPVTAARFVEARHNSAEFVQANEPAARL